LTTAVAGNYFHCIANVVQTGNDIDARAQCYVDAPALGGGGSPLINTQDGVPGPKPPPPYNETAPTEFTGTFNPGDNTFSLQGCFADQPGSIGPNVIIDGSFDLDDLSAGTADIYINQSNANCDAVPPTPLGAAFLGGNLATTLTTAAGGRDFDGDGCTDGQELAVPSGTAGCGEDPYNPHDSDEDLSGPFSASATGIRADWDTVEDGGGAGSCYDTVDNGGNDGIDGGAVSTADVNDCKLIPGSYFLCIGNIVQANPDIDADAFCYVDSPLLDQTGGGGVPSQDDGLDGSPPPPPFNAGTPFHLSGTVSGTNATLTGCVANAGGTLGPNTIVQATIDTDTANGTVDIYGGQTNANCDADPPTPTGAPTLNDVPLEAGEQPKAVADANAPWEVGYTPFDHDGDGCSDVTEVTVASATCGDDPFNRLDSNTEYNSPTEIAITIERKDVGDPGIYRHCKAANTHNLGTQTITSRIYCYADDPAVLVNPSDEPTIFGDGDPGTPPPAPFGDVGPFGAHALMSGMYNVGTGNVEIEGCFATIPGTQGPNIYQRAVFDIQTGQGIVDIWTARPDCTVPGGAPTYNDALWEAAEQAEVTPGGLVPNGWDSDDDGCTDFEELSNAASTGGLRDPYNHWDFFDTPLLPGNTYDKAISVADISRVVARFGANDGGSPKYNRNSDPRTKPLPAPSYHPAYDRSGRLVGSSPWNLDKPNGSITVQDISDTVAQFGNSCTAAP
jgi:hypothetical protein